MKFKTLIVLGTAAMVSTGIYARNSNYVTSQVKKAYTENPVLRNEVANRQNQNTSPEELNDTLQPGVSYWAVPSQGDNTVDDQYVILGLVKITTNQNDEISGRIYTHFTQVSDDHKAEFPAMRCTACSGDMKGKKLIGLKLLSAELNHYRQYRGYFTDPMNGDQYYSALWVMPNGKKIRGYGQTGFFGTAHNTWYRIDNKTAEQCQKWLKQQPYSKPSFKPTDKQKENFDQYVSIEDDATAASVQHKLKKLCQ